jgi:alpha-L-fucosidase
MHRNWALRLISQRPVQRLVDMWLARRIQRDAERGKTSQGIVPPPPAHFDFRTPEYTSFDAIQERKWEATRGLTPSFGFNRRDREEDHEDPGALVRSFVDTVSKNGNLLINLGPRGEDASIPEPQRRRVEALGTWLESNGEAIYDTRPASQAEAECEDGVPVRFTRKGGTLYAILLGTPKSGVADLVLPEPLTGDLQITRLADGKLLGCQAPDGAGAGAAPRVRLPVLPSDVAPAHAFAIRRSDDPER